MTGPNDKDVSGGYGGTERRTNPHLREVFDRAYEIALPILDPQQGVSASGAAHFLRIVLHDAFPHLHQQDLAILCVALQRVFRERNRTATPE